MRPPAIAGPTFSAASGQPRRTRAGPSYLFQTGSYSFGSFFRNRLNHHRPQQAGREQTGSIRRICGIDRAKRDIAVGVACRTRWGTNPSRDVGCVESRDRPASSHHRSIFFAGSPVCEHQQREGTKLIARRGFCSGGSDGRDGHPDEKSRGTKHQRASPRKPFPPQRPGALLVMMSPYGGAHFVRMSFPGAHFACQAG